MKLAKTFVSALFFVTSCTAADTVLIENVTLISPERDAPWVGVNVLIRDGVIEQLSKDELTGLSEPIRVEGKGRYLIPGLIDSHVHLAKVPSMRGGHKKQYPQLAKGFLKQQPRSYLYFGYTSLIDLNVFSPKLIKDFVSEPLHPDVHTCGQNLDIANGHGMFEEDPETRLNDNPNFLYDHHQKQFLQGEFDLTRHTPEKTVKHIKSTGGICIKTYYENGYGGSEMADYDIPTAQIIREVVEEARKQNMPTLLHANSWESQRFALLTDVDVIAHGMFHWGEYRHVDGVPKAIRATLKEIAERGLGYQPTLHVIDSQRSQFDPNYLNHPDLVHAYPAELLDWYKSDEGQWFKKAIKIYLPRHLHGMNEQQMFALFDKYYQKSVRTLGVLAEYDANLLFGTDTIIGQSYANAPGLSGYLDMQAWAKAGVSLKQILDAATINNAKMFNLDDQVGTIEVGKKANLLLLDKNPLQTVTAYNSINKVVLNGQVIPREALSASQFPLSRE